MLVAIVCILIRSKETGPSTGGPDAAVVDWLDVAGPIGAPPTKVCVVVIGGRPRLVGLSLGEAGEGCLHVKRCLDSNHDRSQACLQEPYILNR